MSITTLSSQEFNQDTQQAKQAAQNGPVFITDCGQPSYVLLSIEDYRELARSRRDIADLLGMPGIAEIEFDPPKANIQSKIPDLS